DDFAGPARRGDALHRDERHAGGRQRREEQPVGVERAPGAIRVDEDAGYEDDRAQDRERERSIRDAVRDRRARASDRLLPRDRNAFVMTHDFAGFVKGAGPVGAVSVAPGTLLPVSPGRPSAGPTAAAPPDWIVRR